MKKIVSINLSAKKGEQKNIHPDSVVVTLDGLEGDAHYKMGNRSISLLSFEEIQKFAKEKVGRDLANGEFAENLTVAGLDFHSVSLLDQIEVKNKQDESVLFEITQIGKSCHNQGCAIFKSAGECIMPKQGLFARVIQPGVISAGDEIIYHPKTIRIKIITLSDRAFAGEYEDLSGPRIREILHDFCTSSTLLSSAFQRWPVVIENVLIPDSKKMLLSELEKGASIPFDVILTTGGTGIGPRDFTPEVVTSFCDKLIPGIMEAVRMKYGQENPKAYLSRSIAGVKGETLIYALPGSVKAVSEYMSEILKTLEHLILMLHGLGH